MVTDQEIIDNQNENTQKILECIEALKTNCNNRIAELEQENAELKEQHYADCELVDKTSEIISQLNKAKSIIRQFLNDYPVITKEVLGKLEQFVNEEKDIREDITLDGDWVVDDH